MPVNIAARRFAKAQRRKKAVAEKRKAEIDAGSLAGRVRVALEDPIQFCHVNENCVEFGMATLIVARGTTRYDVSLAVFLIDLWGPGVKDVFLRSVGGGELDAYLDDLSATMPMIPVHPGQARWFLNDQVAKARARGFAPHRDFAKIEPIFGTVEATRPVIEAAVSDDREAAEHATEITETAVAAD